MFFCYSYGDKRLLYLHRFVYSHSKVICLLDFKNTHTESSFVADLLFELLFDVCKLFINPGCMATFSMYPRVYNTTCWLAFHQHSSLYPSVLHNPYL